MARLPLNTLTTREARAGACPEFPTGVLSARHRRRYTPGRLDCAAAVLPNGYRAFDGTPTSITFTGRLFGETALLAVAEAYQRATDFSRRRPPLEALLQTHLEERQEK